MRIAVSGIGVISAIGLGVDENLRNLRAGQSGMGRLTLFASRHAVPVGEVKASNGELKERLKVAPNAIVSRTALLGMAAAENALRDAAPERKLRIGLVSATSVGGMDLTERFFRDFMQDPTRGRIALAAQHDPSQSTARIAAHCGITGYTTTISTACSSAANAIIFAARLIDHGICDVVVAGGCDALSQFTLNGFMSLGILDASPCRPFDASRAGLNLGEGAGYLVLQRVDTLKKEPYCYLTGCANANDAFHQTASSATGEGAFLAMSGALAKAGVAPQQVGYINVHGTGTSNNDATELAAMVRLFDPCVPPFSSTKPFTGHTLAAAGGIEAVYSVLSVAKGFRYENLNFRTPVETTAPTPCTRFEENASIEHVLTNSFGFGGNDTSLLFSKR
ncbi:beta-ketoacyl-[acyl-carrier-protein] synthase family protein [uncultured Alistipes sp.]|uniref:beta-ketoacyl-[acyl-carrier-protein] synthase family protein n=1 Tax=uncultured Alistipes sp. TaxID=538949 RepID=UPI0025E4761D|nr:beta-ketoacyl-[acyl-carrier-protein] synthase family protein [uncultured Alistipes sp.]